LGDGGRGHHMGSLSFLHSILYFQTVPMKSGEVCGHPQADSVDTHVTLVLRDWIQVLHDF
jgi:hypothetical protein